MINMKDVYESVVNYRKRLDEQWEFLLSNYNKDTAIYLMEEYNIVDRWLLNNGYSVDDSKRINQEFFTNDKGETLDLERWNQILDQIEKKTTSMGR